MPQTVNPAHVNGHEHHAHGDGGNGEEFAKQDYLLDWFEIVDIGRYHQENGCCSYAYEKGEVRDIKTPGNLVPHGCDNKSIVKLSAIRNGSDKNQQAEKAQPGIVVLIADGYLLKNDNERTIMKFLIGYILNIPPLNLLCGEKVIEFWCGI
jgi:hypothetical protein